MKNIRPRLVRRLGQSRHLRSGFLTFDLLIILSAGPRIVRTVSSTRMSASDAGGVKAELNTSTPFVATSSIEAFNSSRTSRQLCVRDSRHISFLRAEKRVGNAGSLPDIDEKTEAIEPSSFGFHEPIGVEEWVIVRNLSAASRGMHNSDALRT